MSKRQKIPIGNTVRIKLLKEPDETFGTSRIIVPNNTNTEASKRAEIISVGSTAFGYLFENALDVPRVGDIVTVKKFCGVKSADDDTGNEYRIVRDEDILEISEGIDVEVSND